MLLKTAPSCELEAALGTVEAMLRGKVAGEVGQGADGQTALRAHLGANVNFFAADSTSLRAHLGEGETFFCS